MAARDYRSRPAPPAEMGRRLAGLLHSMLDSVLPRGTVAVVQARPVVRAYSSRAS